MIKLQLTHEQHGLSSHDTNIARERTSAIQMVELLKRGEGVGGGFKGRATNRATIWLGEADWRNVTLPDDYDVDKVQEMVIVDSRGVEPDLKFKRNDKNDRVFVAEQVQQGSVSGTVPGFQSASSRPFNVRRAFKHELDFIGEVGVNDLSYLLNCEIQLPVNHDNAENRELIYKLGERLTEEMGTPVAPNIVVTGATTVRRRELVGEGHLGAHPQADLAMAGRQQIAPRGYPAGTTANSAAAVQAFVTSPSGGEKALTPGQNDQSYGSDGPQDK